MHTTIKNQGTIKSLLSDDYLLTWVESFLIDRKAQNMSKGTLQFYQLKLRTFSDYCEGQVIEHIGEITPDVLRRYLLFLEEQGHNPGGIHACFRVVRTFLYWWEKETEPEGWKNPIKRVKAPKVGIDPLEPVELDDLQAMLKKCEKGSIFGERDRAIFLGLLDTGARAQEFLDVNLEDIDLVSGAVLIRKGKGAKPRTVFLGKQARKALRAYLKLRTDGSQAVWVSREGERLTYWGLRQMVRRRAEQAGVEEPSLHSFRRGFALNMLRAGVDVYSLQALMGHADLQILRRYLHQTNEDLQEAHRKGSPVDNWNL